MNELPKSKIKYNVRKIKNEIYFSVNQLFTEKKIYVQDYIYDKKSDQWIFALKCISKSYQFDYVFLDNNFKVIEVLTEDKGVMPNFLIAPNQDIWVEMTETFSGKNIYLPLYNRSRIEKQKNFKDLGMACFFTLSDNCYSYFIDSFDKNKFDDLYIYKFDENNLLKDRKKLTLDDVHNGYPLIINNNCYIAYGKWDEDICDLYINELDDKGNFISKWKGDSVDNIDFALLISFEDDKRVFITFYDVNIELLEYNKKGKIISRKIIYECEKEIFIINKPKVIGNIKSIEFSYEGGNAILLLKNDKVKVIKAEKGYTLSLLNEKLIISKPIVGENKFKIIEL